MTRKLSPSCQAIVEMLEFQPTVESVLSLLDSVRFPVVLESSNAPVPYGRVSIVAFDPVTVLELPQPDHFQPIQWLGQKMAQYPRIDAGTRTIPFVGGWIGYLSYEAGLAIENIQGTARRDVDLPLLRMALYDSALLFDHPSGQWMAAAVDWGSQQKMSERPPTRERVQRLSDFLAQATHDFPEDVPAPRTSPAESNMSYPAYVEAVEKVKEYIEAGDVYQVNLTQRFTAQTEATPLQLYRRLRRFCPSSHAAYLAWEDKAILCASPELFLDLHDGQVVTRPIKGTRPRGQDATMDCALRDELEKSEKDRAELVMIVDLLRNDLGRVCVPGSIRVTHPGETEVHPNVFHRVATIEGKLEADRNWLDLLLAAFPGGSITGAPKIRAMQIISELEPTQRGVYCGAIGWIGLDGSMSLNIAIRTMVQIGSTVHCHAGGAIVADSDAEAEYAETLAKADGMFKAIGTSPRND